MPQRWQFEQDGNLRWRWKRLDDQHGEVGSVGSFPDQTACMLDAVRYAVRRRRSNPESGWETLLQ